MGCGSVLGDLFYLTDSLLPPPSPRANFPAPGSRPLELRPRSGDLLARLYNMHGEGQIGEEVFTALRELARRGQLRPADLAVHEARARRRPAGRAEAEVGNALRGIRSRLARLDEARQDAEGVLSDLQTRLSDLDERIAVKADAAREAVGKGDEAAGRLRLMEKAELSGRRDGLLRQERAMREELTRLKDLRAQLEARAVELEAVLARSRLASLGAEDGAKGGM